MKNIKKKVKTFIKECWRAPLRWSMRRKLKNHSFSLISANCIGGVLSHDVGEQFRTPTLNLTIPQFVDFCEDLENNLKTDLIPSELTYNGHPVCKCGNIDIIGVHYSSCEDLIETWNRRKVRVNYDNIFLIATDEFINSEELAQRFDSLPFPKVCFTANSHPKYDWMVFLPEFEGANRVGDSLRYTNMWGLRIFEKHFDCVKWLNDNDIKPKDI